MALRALCLKLYPSSYLPYPITKDGLRIDEAWIQKRVSKLAAGVALLVIGSAIGVRKASSYWRWIIPAGVAVMGGLTCLFWSYFDRWIAKGVIVQHQEKQRAEKVLGRKLSLFAGKEQRKQNFPELQKEFSLVKNNAEKFCLLVTKFVLTQVDRPIAKTCQFLERLEWPFKELKEELLPKLIMELLEANGFVSWQETSINFKDQKLSTYKVVLDLRQIFGCGDFTEKPQQMSRYIVEAIRLRLNFLGEWTLKQLKENRAEAADLTSLRIGLYVEISQFTECRFPASMVSPLLPCLAKIPGLIGLELIDIGTEKFNEKKEKAGGFGDEDADVLLEVLRQQPFLQNIMINLEAMSEGKRAEILAEMKKPRSSDLVQGLLEAANKLEDKQS